MVPMKTMLATVWSVFSVVLKAGRIQSRRLGSLRFWLISLVIWKAMAPWSRFASSISICSSFRPACDTSWPRRSSALALT